MSFLRHSFCWYNKTYASVVLPVTGRFFEDLMKEGTFDKELLNLIIMRRLLLLAAITLFLPRVSAQSISKAIPGLRSIPLSSANSKAINPKLHRAAKTTSLTIATETFGTGSDSTLPLGWTAGIIAGPGTWHWTNVASTSAYSMGPMNSTTSANGWMIFDSDSLGDTCHCAPAGWLQSPAYNCDSDTTVQLSFEEYYQSLYDSCVVWVSTDPAFGTYTRYPVMLNRSLPANGATANVATVQINITSAAALQPAVYIRFVYYDESGQNGGYSWMIDDLSLTKLKAYDIGLSGGFMYVPDSPAYNSIIFSTPLAFLDSVYPITYLSNTGGHADSNIYLNAIIYDPSGAVVYSKSDTIAGLSLNATDSVFRFPAFYPPYASSFLCQFSAAFRGDSVTADNRDTSIFSVSDTIWNINQGPITESYYLYKPGPSPFSYFRGTRFDVPPNCVGDTVSGFGVVFSSGSVPTEGNATVSVQLYSIKQNESSWTYVGTSVAKPVILSDISTITATNIDFFRIDPFSSGGVNMFVLRPGTTYAAVIQTDSVTTQLLVDATAASPEYAYTGYFGLYDTSLNNGSPTFNPLPGAGLPEAVPMVQLYFGNNPVDYTQIKNQTLVNDIGIPYPVPADNSITIPLTLAMDARVTVTLTDITGRQVRSESAAAKGGQQMKVTLPLNDLPDGIYIYSVTTDGQYTNGRISIVH